MGRCAPASGSENSRNACKARPSLLSSGATIPRERGDASDQWLSRGHERAALADQEIEVGALVGLQHVVDVELQ